MTLASGVGCNAIAGIHEPLDPASEAGAGTSGGTANIDLFVGTWVTSTATQTVDGCPQAVSGTRAITLTIEKTGTSPGEITASNDIAPGCFLVLNVSGDTATLAPGQTCTFTGGGDTLTYSYASAGTFSVASGTSGLEGSEHLIATYTSAVGGFTCNFDELAVFAKQPQ